jgi:hypothetical protein
MDLAARLDWDFFNHVSHVSVHWLPVKDMNAIHGLKIFTKLVQNEVASIEQSRGLLDCNGEKE